MILENTIHEQLKCNSANIKTALLDCERLKKPVTFYTRARIPRKRNGVYI